jgi:hypothetical protein
MYPIQMLGTLSVVADKKLRAARVGATVRHAQYATVVVLPVALGFAGDGVAGATHAGTLRTAGLHHKVGYHPVEDKAIVKALANQLLKIGHGNGCRFVVQFKMQSALVGLYRTCCCHDFFCAKIRQCPFNRHQFCLSYPTEVFDMKWLFLLLLAGSCCAACFYSGHLTDKAYYQVERSGVMLVQRAATDSFAQDSYERSQGWGGSWCKKLMPVRRIDTTAALGISFRLWAKTVMAEPGTFYGPYPRLGLLQKIDTLRIWLEGDGQRLDLAPYLQGDSSIKGYLWAGDAPNPLRRAYYMTGNCYRLPYFATVADCLHTLNHQHQQLGNIDHYDFVFWVDRSLWAKLSFQPTALGLALTLTDSTHTRFTPIGDRWALQ